MKLDTVFRVLWTLSIAALASLASPGCLSAPTADEIRRCDEENSTAATQAACKEDRVWARYEIAAVATGMDQGKVEGRKLWLLVVGPGEVAVPAKHRKKVEAHLRSIAEKEVLRRLTSTFDKVPGADQLLEERAKANPQLDIAAAFTDASAKAKAYARDVVIEAESVFRRELHTALGALGTDPDRFRLALQGLTCLASEPCTLPAYASRWADGAFDRYAKYHDWYGDREMNGAAYGLVRRPDGAFDLAPLLQVQGVPRNVGQAPALELAHFEQLVAASRNTRLQDGRVLLSSVTPRMLKLSTRSSIAIVDTLKSPAALLAGYRTRPPAPAVDLVSSSDAVARTRIVDCTVLRGKVAASEISQCAGFDVSTQMIADCRQQAARCWPAPLANAMITVDVSSVVAADDHDALAAFTALPRVLLAKDEAQLRSLHEKCIQPGGAGAAVIDATTCLLLNSPAASGNKLVQELHRCTGQAATAHGRKSAGGQASPAFQGELMSCLAQAVKGAGASSEEARQVACLIETRGDLFASTFCSYRNSAGMPWAQTLYQCANAGNGAPGGHLLQGCLGQDPSLKHAKAVYDCVDQLRSAKGGADDKAAQQASLASCLNALDKGSAPAARAVLCAKQVADASKSLLDATLESCLGADANLQAAKTLFDCAKAPEKDWKDVIFCGAKDKLPPELVALKKCADTHRESAKAALCFASAALKLPPEVRKLQQIAVCMSQAGADPLGAAVCAAGDKMTADQRIALQCASTTGGEPSAWTVCVAGKLMAKEIQNCRGKKFGQGNCLNENNEIRKLFKTAGFEIGPKSVPADIVNFYLQVYAKPLELVANAEQAAQQVVASFTSTLINELKTPTGAIVLQYAAAKSACTTLAKVLFGRKKRC